MPIQFRCNACGQTLSVRSRLAGQTVDCVGCGAPVRVPDGATPRTAPRSMPERQIEALESVPPEEAAPPITFASTEDSGRGAEVEQPVASPSPAGPTPRRPPRPDVGGFSMGMARPVDQEEMDLTPMVDMTFLLLIFFMITASFSVQKSMGVPPPSSEKKGAAQSIQSLDDLAETSIAVRIDERNVIYIDDDPVPGSMRLTDVLMQKFSAQRNELLLTAEDGALHDTVIAVIDAANEIGVQKIRMTSTARD